jgi:hypothetical protein
MKDAALPVVLIVLGIAWLPEIRWLWILGLAGAGIFMLVARSPAIPESRTLTRRYQDRGPNG